MPSGATIASAMRIRFGGNGSCPRLIDGKDGPQNFSESSYLAKKTVN